MTILGQIFWYFFKFHYIKLTFSGTKGDLNGLCQVIFYQKRANFGFMKLWVALGSKFNRSSECHLRDLIWSHMISGHTFFIPFRVLALVSILHFTSLCFPSLFLTSCEENRRDQILWLQYVHKIISFHAWLRCRLEETWSHEHNLLVLHNHLIFEERRLCKISMVTD